jgi:hypothetical protein
LEVLIEQLDIHPEAGLVYCQSWEIDEHEHILSRLEWNTLDLDPARWEHYFSNHGRDECRQYLIFKNTIPNASAVLFRRAVYQQVGGVPENLKLSGD